MKLFCQLLFLILLFRLGKAQLNEEAQLVIARQQLNNTTSLSSTLSTTSAPTGSSTSDWATSAPTDCDYFLCNCSSNLTALDSQSNFSCHENGSWTIFENSLLSDGTIIIASTDTIYLDGSFTQTQTGALIIFLDPVPRFSAKSRTGAALKITGEATLAGNLTIMLTQGFAINWKPQSQPPIIEAKSIKGSFSTITVNTLIMPSTKCTAKAQGNARVSNAQLFIGISPPDCSKNDKSKIIAIAVGASIGGGVILTVLVIIFLIVARKKGWFGYVAGTSQEMREELSRRSSTGSDSQSVL